MLHKILQCLDFPIISNRIKSRRILEKNNNNIVTAEMISAQKHLYIFITFAKLKNQYK